MIPIGHKLFILGATSSTDEYRTVNILDTGKSIIDSTNMFLPRFLAYLNYTTFERPSSSLSMGSELSDISDLDMDPRVHMIETSHDDINGVSDDGCQSETGSTPSSTHVEPWFSTLNVSPVSSNASVKSTDQHGSASQVARSSGSALVQLKTDAKNVSFTRAKPNALERPEISKNVHAIYVVRVPSQL